MEAGAFVFLQRRFNQPNVERPGSVRLFQIVAYSRTLGQQAEWSDVWLAFNRQRPARQGQHSASHVQEGLHPRRSAASDW